MRRLLPLALLLAFAAPSAHAKPDPPPDHWVGSWATANYAQSNLLPNGSPFAETLPGASGITLRQIIRPTLAGPILRVTFSNAFGTEPLLIGAAHIALAQKDGAVALLSANALTFNGLPSITIPPGAAVVSDPAALPVTPGTDLAVSLYLPAQKISTLTFHNDAHVTSYTAPGNQVGKATLTTPTTLTHTFFLKSLEVRSTYDTAAIIAFGDSITDGARSTVDSHSTWPEELSRRLQSAKSTRNLAVLNMGIGGNRVLHDGTGPGALARLNRDVFALPGVRYLIFLESINDIGHAQDPNHPYDVVTAQDLIQGLANLTERAHEHNIKVIGATLTPYLGAGYSSPAGEAIRQQVNDWIRTTKLLDGVIDFDAATRNPAAPTTFNPAFDSGDKLHPSDTGYKAMGDSINLKLFQPTKQEKYDIRRGE